jgi:hypothetical protein
LHYRYSVGQAHTTNPFTGESTGKAKCPTNPKANNRKAEQFYWDAVASPARPISRDALSLLSHRMDKDPKVLNDERAQQLIHEALAEPEEYAGFNNAYLSARFRLLGDKKDLLALAHNVLEAGDASKRVYYPEQTLFQYGRINIASARLDDFYGEHELILYLDQQANAGSATAALILHDYYSNRDEAKAKTYKALSAQNGFIGAQRELFTLKTEQGRAFAAMAAEKDAEKKFLLGVGYAVGWQGAPNIPDKGIPYLKQVAFGGKGSDGSASSDYYKSWAERAARRLALFLGCQGRFKDKLAAYCSIEDAYAFARLSDQDSYVEKYRITMTAQQIAKAEERYQEFQRRHDENILMAKVARYEFKSAIEDKKIANQKRYGEAMNARSRSMTGQ